MLLERQAEVEERHLTREEMHEEFRKAGFYRMFMPRRYGGLEVDVPTFMRVVVEIARGCPSTGWCLALASNHALMVGSWFCRRPRTRCSKEVFTCASVAAPISEPAVKVEGGWELNGKVSLLLRDSVLTYYLGQALTPGDGDTSARTDAALRRAEGDVADARRLGRSARLQGSGSQSILFEHGRIPDHWRSRTCR